MLLRELGEFGLIERLSGQLGLREGVITGIGDDAAVLAPLACPVVSADALIEGVHFRRDWTAARLLGRKAMAVNISDLAAAGSAPVAAFICLALAADETVEFVEELYVGLEEMALRHHFTIAGGDMTRSPGPLMISITLVGRPLSPTRGPLGRAGALAGDVLLVSGELGGSAAGLALLSRANSVPGLPGGMREAALARHLDPTPRLDAMRAALDWDATALHAALDLSDGLAGDAVHLARRSSLEVRIRTEDLPVAKEARAIAWALGTDPTDYALMGGEDYELLLAVAPGRVQALQEQVLERAGVPLTPIGECAAGAPAVQLLKHGHERSPVRGFTHF